ncbi:FMN reductase [Phyllobacterium sp. 21LDTY02-6]|uniref:FMN reductase n=1 Tax=Phyllobacterium sp. 21LDTY02-6 TaxID=2944903 RepID=UPI002021B975|nr:FMN reductase [Phyllobacterium sp. 21LDTY02-6]MCO4316571.1 FMN reductase [Phyllobacterium sp. 21LDTY02-6]
MSNPTVVGLSGNVRSPSKTKSLVTSVVTSISRQYGLTAEVYDLIDVGASLGTAHHASELSPAATAILDKVVAADILVVGTATYKGSYTGLFKHFIDLLEPRALQGKPIVLTATGGNNSHALIIEHQLRPLFGFFAAHTLPTGIFGVDRDFADNEIASEPVRLKIAQIVEEVRPFVAQLAFPAASAAE